MGVTFTFENHRQNGFSLVEIMVGMVIGMLGIIIMMQVTSVFEGRKRTTTGGDDAQNSGAIALYSVQHDVAQAGYGISTPYLIGKSLTTANITLNPLRPVIVNHADLAAIGDAGTDTFLLVYGNSNYTTEGALITNSTASLPYKVTDGTGQRGTAEGGKSFAIGEWVIPSQSGVTACTAAGCVSTAHQLFQVIGPVSVADVAVSGVPPALAVPNQANPPLLFNLGQTPSILAYAIVNGFLSVCNYMNNDCDANPAAWTQLSGDIVSMRARCEAGNSLRVALVTRSTQVDPTVVTTSTPSWNPNGVSAPVTASPTHWNSTQAWDHYRYKTFETVIPIRNAIWSGVTGC